MRIYRFKKMGFLLAGILLLTSTAGGDEIVAEMEEIVQEMYITYWNRINSSMLRFTDTRLLKRKISDAPQYDYIPVMGAGHMPKDADFNCSVNNGRTPVEKYASITRGAHGAVDFWGNVWEWTSTVRGTGNTQYLTDLFY